ncbi:hypothetical protein [Verrucomicrobium sp. BvORR034]|uniref:hypothetical protein n=1 Tax=Verrucomicrobium sp. BvORR034 TaxID=1396418 RepID=UPI000678C5D9|nr:hypothetical protein [Verrucomicrobium sp. BvORR034]
MTSHLRRLASGLALLALFVLGSAGLVEYAITEPDSAVGIPLFRLRYASNSDKAAFLTAFSAELALHEGGSIPPQIDANLARRFLTTPSASERIGIVDFFVHQQIRGRPGRNLHVMGEPFVEQVFARIPSYDQNHQLAALAAIEGCRRGNSIGKYYLSPLASAVTHHKLPFETVLHAYEQWWRTDTPWPEKTATNPIAALPYDWSEP